MKKVIALIGIMIVGVAAFVVAQSDLLTADYSAAGWTPYYGRTQSVGLPEADSTKRWGVAIYTFKVGRTDKDGDTMAAAATYQTQLNLPDNAIVRDAWVDVGTAVLPTNSTISMGFNTATDIQTAVTNYNVAGQYQLIPDLATIGDAVKLTAARDFKVAIGTATATQGSFTVYCEYVLGQ